MLRNFWPELTTLSLHRACGTRWMDISFLRSQLNHSKFYKGIFRTSNNDATKPSFVPYEFDCPPEITTLTTQTGQFTSLDAVSPQDGTIRSIVQGRWSVHCCNGNACRDGIGDKSGGKGGIESDWERERWMDNGCKAVLGRLTRTGIELKRLYPAVSPLTSDVHAALSKLHHLVQPISNWGWTSTC